MTPETEALKVWADGTPATLDPATLVAEMNRVWRECMKYNRGPSVMCIPGGLWLRADGRVSYCMQAWREPDEADRQLIDRFRGLITAQDFPLTEPPAPKYLPVDPVKPDPSPCWHKHRGSRRR